MTVAPRPAARGKNDKLTLVLGEAAEASDDTPPGPVRTTELALASIDRPAAVTREAAVPTLGVFASFDTAATTSGRTDPASTAVLLARHVPVTPEIDIAVATAERHVRESGSALLRIEAAAIGAVSVEVSQQSDGISVVFMSTMPEVRHALVDAQPRLAADARAAGFTLADASVDGGGPRDRRAPRAPARALPREAAPTLRTSADRFA